METGKNVSMQSRVGFFTFFNTRHRKTRAGVLTDSGDFYFKNHYRKIHYISHVIDICFRLWFTWEFGACYKLWHTCDHQALSTCTNASLNVWSTCQTCGAVHHSDDHWYIHLYFTSFSRGFRRPQVVHVGLCESHEIHTSPHKHFCEGVTLIVNWWYIDFLT